jgi:hypothetical protein
MSKIKEKTIETIEKLEYKDLDKIRHFLAKVYLEEKENFAFHIQN